MPKYLTTGFNVLQPKDALQGDARNDVSVKRIKGENCIGVEITSKDNSEIFLFSNERKIVYGDIQSHSKWISVLKDRTGNTIKTTSWGKFELEFTQAPA